MILYSAGDWGWGQIFGLSGSAFPRSFVMAVPNAILAYILVLAHDDFSEQTQDQAKFARRIMGWFSTVLTFILFGRARNAYSRWWEGGTLLQQVRGEWFNAYSSLMAFVSADPAHAESIEAFQHMLARLMSQLFRSALQQVSKDHDCDRPFEVMNSDGLEERSMEFLQGCNDKVEIMLQWVQKSTVNNMRGGIIPTPPPVVSRAFQELSRGIVNLQNARKITDFPYPFPYAQAVTCMMILHWALCPILTSIMLDSPHWAAFLAGIVTWFLWCVHFVSLDLEFPFGTGGNDLPMEQMTVDWNKSIATLLSKHGSQPPAFKFDPEKHRRMDIVMCPRHAEDFAE